MEEVEIQGDIGEAVAESLLRVGKLYSLRTASFTSYLVGLGCLEPFLNTAIVSDLFFSSSLIGVVAALR